MPLIGLSGESRERPGDGDGDGDGRTTQVVGSNSNDGLGVGIFSDMLSDTISKADDDADVLNQEDERVDKEENYLTSSSMEESKNGFSVSSDTRNASSSDLGRQCIESQDYEYEGDIKEDERKRMHRFDTEDGESEEKQKSSELPSSPLLDNEKKK